MIIDADVHISPVSEGNNSINVEELIKRMDKADVDKAITWLQPPYMREIKEANKYIYESSVRFPDRILGFGWVDPHFGLEESKNIIKRCIYEYNFYGIKLNGAQNSFFIDDPELALPLIEEIAKTGRILALHVGADDYERTHPFRVGKIAKMFPEVNILMVHMGGASFADLSHAAIEVAQECQNITLIGSAIRTIPIIRAIRTLGTRRVCFGSDTPFELMHVEVARYNALLNGEVSEDGKKDIMGGNIARLFKLKAL
ncbi:amidohydrolase family protein [Mahella australiensis]|uniref:Amidohydrolase 2 n=1 Tax=Mahella australiensis (strain DSM 15567 / CIP 107919 / 50-1 BON) TaxID=697281 RepID=F3ZZ98_MAHA5|nr:amidohydrolase family protein [Mahella australiensis]AEE97880.1 amidohydrolase 2 [Mahella australiensis 50-1 BON]